MTRTTLLIALALPALGGCVIHDNDCPGDDGFWADEGPDRGDVDGDGDGDGGPSIEMWLTPDTAVPGETLIAGLQAEVQFDWSSVSEVVLYGDAVPCTIQAREDELLITIAVDDDAALGAVDLLVLLEDGHAMWVDDALWIVSADDAADDGADDDGADDDGAGDGSSDGSSGGSGGGSTDGGSTDGGSTDDGGNSSADDNGLCG